jgi:hypothetical protein
MIPPKCHDDTTNTLINTLQTTPVQTTANLMTSSVP